LEAALVVALDEWADDFTARLCDFVQRLDCRRAQTVEERLAIYQLRYRAYLRENAIQPHPAEMFKDNFDDMPNVWIFGCYLDGRLAGSIRVHLGSPAHPATPASSVFGDVLNPEIQAGRFIIDPTRFVADPDIARDHPLLPYGTVRLGFLACEHFDADIGLATVREEHRAFYRRLYFMRQMGGPRVYPGLRKPITMMGVEYPEVREKILARHPFLRSTAAEREALYGPAPSRIVPHLLRPATIAAMRRMPPAAAAPDLRAS
jgi:hypothetical protein